MNICSFCDQNVFNHFEECSGPINSNPHRTKNLSSTKLNNIESAPCPILQMVAFVKGIFPSQTASNPKRPICLYTFKTIVSCCLIVSSNFHLWCYHPKKKEKEKKITHGGRNLSITYGFKPKETYILVRVHGNSVMLFDSIIE